MKAFALHEAPPMMARLLFALVFAVLVTACAAKPAPVTLTSATIAPSCESACARRYPSGLDDYARSLDRETCERDFDCAAARLCLERC